MSKITEPLRIPVTVTVVVGSFNRRCKAAAKEAVSEAFQEDNEYEPPRRNTKVDIIDGQVCVSVIEHRDA